MVLLNDLLDSESHTMRGAMLEVLGNVIHGHLMKEDSEVATGNTLKFFDIFIERFLDSNYFVRARVLKVMMKLAQRHPDNPHQSDIPIGMRQQILDNTILRLRDKATLVRKRAMELVIELMDNSPFIVDKEGLCIDSFQARFRNLQEVIKEQFPEELMLKKNQDEVMEEEQPAQEEQEGSEPRVRSLNEEQNLQQLKGMLLYYQRAIEFAQSLDKACEIVAELLSSTLKTEVIVAMKFFVVANRFAVKGAQVGVKKMVHKVWDKDTGDKEAGSIKDVLMQSFYDIHMDPPHVGENLDVEIAKNLINLVNEMDLAQITSLEELLSIMTEENRIPESLSDILWEAFQSRERDVMIDSKKYALILLGMIGKSKKEVLLDNLDILTRVGLGELVTEDFSVAKYACIALQQLYSVKRQKGMRLNTLDRLPMQHPTCDRVVSVLLQPSTSLYWFSMAEQGINALYSISEHPDILCGEIIKVLDDRVFSLPKSPDESLAEITNDLQEATLDEGKPEVLKETTGNQDSLKLAQLLFVVGHVAIKQIVHLETIESDWKRKKNNKEAAQNKNNDLEMVTGTAEDEFVDCVAAVRERELLFGPNSILSGFGPLIVNVCTHNQKYRHPILQVMATVSLCKLMCVSSDFCEAHLQILFTILERSQNPLIRSNIIIGLGDLTICFNSLIDQNISYLYNRLKDTAFHVRKNTLMVLTFLILNGMIKVKGQISEMARCTEDEDEEIRNMAKAFFKELSTKDNAIYNNLPDIISNLSTTEEGQYQRIVKFLFGFITKEKQSDSIVEKLCLRFQHASDERQWRDIGYCLSLLSFGTEKSIKRLVEYLPLYQDKLYEDSLFKYLTDITSRAMKSGKQEFKAMIDTYKQNLQAAREKAIENYQAANDAKSKAPAKLSIPVLDFSQEFIPPAEIEDEEDEENLDILTAIEKEDKVQEKLNSDATLTDDDAENPTPVIPKKKTPKKGTKKAVSKPKATPKRTSRRKAVVDSSDEE